MPIEVTMPQLSDTMSEGRILAWLKKEGDRVKRGEALAEVATDKADLEIESFHEGTLLKINTPVGTTVKVGSVIALIGEPTEGGVGVERTLPKVETPKVETPRPSGPVTEPVISKQVTPPVVVPAPQRPTDERVKISPLARNLAEVHGVQYAMLSGTGEGGRIVKRDIERALGREIPSEDVERVRGGAREPISNSDEPMISPSSVVSEAKDARGTPCPSTSGGEKKGSASVGTLSQMRRTIADRMIESASTIPHFYVTTKVECTELLRLKETLKPLPEYENLTLNHLVIRGTALALRAYPRLNAAYRDGNLYQPQEVNIGIITAVADGLLIPVLKNADELPLADTAAEARALVQRARSGRPKSADLVGATFCISNMGMFAVESFTAIINPGNGAILAVSSVQDEPVVVNGRVEVGKVLRLTLSVDHRIIDGVMAGEFLTELKRLLEEPVLLLA